MTELHYLEIDQKGTWRAYIEGARFDTYNAYAIGICNSKGLKKEVICKDGSDYAVITSVGDYIVEAVSSKNSMGEVFDLKVSRIVSINTREKYIVKDVLYDKKGLSKAPTTSKIAGLNLLIQNTVNRIIYDGIKPYAIIA